MQCEGNVTVMCKMWNWCEGVWLFDLFSASFDLCVMGASRVMLTAHLDLARACVRRRTSLWNRLPGAALQCTSWIKSFLLNIRDSTRRCTKSEANMKEMWNPCEEDISALCKVEILFFLSRLYSKSRTLFRDYKLLSYVLIFEKEVRVRCVQREICL